MIALTDNTKYTQHSVASIVKMLHLEQPRGYSLREVHQILGIFLLNFVLIGVRYLKVFKISDDIPILLHYLLDFLPAFGNHHSNTLNRFRTLFDREHFLFEHLLGTNILWLLLQKPFGRLIIIQLISLFFALILHIQ